MVRIGWSPSGFRQRKIRSDKTQTIFKALGVRRLEFKGGVIKAIVPARLSDVIKQSKEKIEKAKRDYVKGKSIDYLSPVEGYAYAVAVLSDGIREMKNFDKNWHLSEERKQLIAPHQKEIDGWLTDIFTRNKPLMNMALSGTRLELEVLIVDPERGLKTGIPKTEFLKPDPQFNGALNDFINTHEMWASKDRAKLKSAILKEFFYLFGGPNDAIKNYNEAKQEIRRRFYELRKRSN